MRHNPFPILFFIALFLTTSVPLFAGNNLLDVVESAQTTIQKKFPNRDSIARKMALEELEKIARSGKSDEEIVNAILEKFPETSAELAARSDRNSNGIPDDWEKEYRISDGFTAPESDEDADGFTLLQEYKAKTDPLNPLSHPRYITQVYVSAVSRQRFTGLELVSVDTSKPDRRDWNIVFNVTRNNRKRSENARLNLGTFRNNNVDFCVVDIEVDKKTQEPVVYLQRIGKVERIPCRPKQAVYEPVQRVRFVNALYDKTFNALDGEQFKLGTEKTGEETYKVVSSDPVTKTAVVESVGEKPETIKVQPLPVNHPPAAAARKAPAKSTAAAKAATSAKAVATARAIATATAVATAKAVAGATAAATVKAVANARSAATVAKAPKQSVSSVPPTGRKPSVKPVSARSVASAKTPAKNAAKSAPEKSKALPLPIFHKKNQKKSF